MFKNVLSNIQNWIIKFVAGKKTIILNANMDGSIYVAPNKKSYIFGNQIVKRNV
jgi:hypothetical protein